MKKRIRLNESELTDLIKSVVVETKKKQQVNEQAENFFNPEAMETADAIYTIIGTTIGLLGIAGYDILKQYARELMSAGKKKEAREMMTAIKDMQSKGEGELGEGIAPGNCTSTCGNPCKWPSYWQEKCGCKCKPEMK